LLLSDLLDWQRKSLAQELSPSGVEEGAWEYQTSSNYLLSSLWLEKKAEASYINKKSLGGTEQKNFFFFQETFLAAD